MRVDPDCPANSNSVLSAALRGLGVAYLLASIGGAILLRHKARQSTAEIDRLADAVAQLEGGFQPLFPVDSLRSLTWMWYGGAVGLVIQGIAMAGLLIAGGSILQSLIGIRISARVTAQAAHDARTQSPR
jgi:hypothetical protein